MISRMARTVESRRRMVAYYAALAVLGAASLTLATLPAMAFGAGYVAGGALGVRARWSRRHHDEAWVIIGLAILSVWQIRSLRRSSVGPPCPTREAASGSARRRLTRSSRPAGPRRTVTRCKWSRLSLPTSPSQLLTPLPPGRMITSRRT